MNDHICEPTYHNSTRCNFQLKIWISAALRKANIAVLYDERGHSRNAIFYYLEAVGLLNKVINNSDSLKPDIEGLEIICDIYFKRIEILYNITQNQHTAVYASQENTYNSTFKYPTDNEFNTKEYIPEMIEDAAKANNKQDSISSTFSKIFSKKNLKINTKQKDNQGANNGILSPLKQFTRHSSLIPGKSSRRQ